MSSKGFITTFLFAFAIFAQQFVFASERLAGDVQAALNKSRDNFVQATLANDFDRVLDVIPPKVFAYISTNASVSEEELRSNMSAMFKEVMADIEVAGVQMRTEEIAVNRSIDESGKNYIWGFVPTSIELVVANERLKIEAHTLAMREDDVWYFLRTSELQQVVILKNVYPFFAGVEFPGSTVSAQ